MTKLKVNHAELAAVLLEPDRWHGEWNYTISQVRNQSAVSPWACAREGGETLLSAEPSSVATAIAEKAVSLVLTAELVRAGER